MFFALPSLYNFNSGIVSLVTRYSNRPARPHTNTATVEEVAQNALTHNEAAAVNGRLVQSSSLRIGSSGLPDQLQQGTWLAMSDEESPEEFFNSQNKKVDVCAENDVLLPSIAYDEIVIPYIQQFRDNTKKYTQAFIRERPPQNSNYLYDDDHWDRRGCFVCNATAPALVRYLKTQHVIEVEPTREWSSRIGKLVSQIDELMQKNRLSKQIGELEQAWMKEYLAGNASEMEAIENKLQKLGGALSSIAYAASPDELSMDDLFHDDQALDETVDLDDDLLCAPEYVVEHPGINHISITNKKNVKWGHEFVIVNSGSRMFIVQSNVFTRLKMSDDDGLIEVDQSTLRKMFAADARTCDRLFGISDIEIRINKIAHYQILSDMPRSSIPK